MRKGFYFLSLAIVAWMLSLSCVTAYAAVYDAGTAEELYSLITQGKDPVSNSDIAPTDTIRLTANINITQDDNITSFVIPSQTERTLDLNGYTLNKTSAETKGMVCLFYLSDKAVINIMDSRTGGQIICNRTITDNGDYLCSVFCNVPGWTIYNIGTSTVNLYGGNLQTTFNGAASAHCSVIVGQMGSYEYYSQQAGERVTDYTVYHYFTLNMYGGVISDYNNTLSGRELMHGTTWRAIYFTHPVYFNLNVYDGTIGTSNTLSSHTGLCYGWADTKSPSNFRNAVFYGLSFRDQESHDGFFNNLDPNIKIYINNVQTPVTTCQNAANDAYAHSKVELRYEPEISVSTVEVTRDNYTDILAWVEFKASFDYSTNTLHLKTLAPNNVNVLNGITFKDFDLRIVVDGHWRINGTIVGTNGDLIITSAHYALTEMDGDALVMQPGNETSIQLDGHQLVLSNRVRLICYNSEMNTTPQSAVKCHDMWVNNSWFDAWGKKPVVDCAYGSVVNAHIKVGSFKNNDVISIEPNLQSYIVSVVESEGGEVTPDSYGRVGVTYNGNTTNYTYNEGVSIQMTATPKSGYHFLRWSNGVTDNPYTFTVTQDTVLCALFEADEVINYYDITVVSEDETMGTVSGGGTHIEEGQTVTITATPKSGYQFLYWTTANGQVQSGNASTEWTVTKDETLIAHFRVQPPADAISLWVCGTQVTGSNSADILGDGVWCYDHATRTLSTMKMATYNIENHGFIEDWVTDADPLTVVFNHLIDATCTTTDNVIRTAIVSTKGMTFTGSAYNGPTVTAKNMYVANFSDVFTVTGHITTWLYLQNTSDFGRNYFTTAILLAGKTPSLVVNGANLEVLSGIGESTGYKVSNKTDQAANLSLANALVDDGSISAKSLYISDNSPKYQLNYITPSLESLCQVGGFGEWYEGTYCTLRAYPQTGYKFVAWSDGNTDNPRYMVMPAENTYLDPIVEIDNSQTPKGAIINASATEGQGSIIGFTSGWYAEGTELTITAQPAEGYEFVQWSDGHETNPYYLTVEDGKNISITAMFCEKGQGIDEVQSNKVQSTKVLRNGILYIERNGKTYNAQGAELNTEN